MTPHERVVEAAWWIVGLVAVVAFFALAYLVEFSWYAVLDWFWGLW